MESTIGTKFGKRFGDKLSMVETTFPDVMADGGERNNDGRSFGGWKGCVEDFGKGMGKSAYGMIFEIMNELANQIGTVADNKNWG